MTPEDVKTRRGEPVVIHRNGRWVPGYIEFGDEASGCISVATEPGGAREVLRGGDLQTRLRPDPGGARPLRDRRGIPWPPPTTRTITKRVDDLIAANEDPPLPLSVIPNYMGINLCSVDSVSWVEQEADGQLVSLTIHFSPFVETKP